jgi:hypothetical protein
LDHWSGHLLGLTKQSPASRPTGEIWHASFGERCLPSYFNGH